MTITRTDPEAIQKIRLINNSNLKTMNDIEDLTRAARLFERCYCDASAWTNVRLCDADAWGSVLERRPQGQIARPALTGDGRALGAPAIAEQLVVSSKNGYMAK